MHVLGRSEVRYIVVIVPDCVWLFSQVQPITLKSFTSLGFDSELQCGHLHTAYEHVFINTLSGLLWNISLRSKTSKNCFQPSPLLISFCRPSLLDFLWELFSPFWTIVQPLMLLIEFVVT